MKLGIVCCSKLILFVLTFQVFECSAKIISISVRHVENFEVQEAGDQDVVQLDDSDIMEAWKKELILDELRFEERQKLSTEIKDSQAERRAKDGEIRKHQNHLHHQRKKIEQMLDRQKDEKIRKMSEYHHLGNLESIERPSDSDEGVSGIDEETVEDKGIKSRNHLSKEENNILGEIKSVIGAEEEKQGNSILKSTHRSKMRKIYKNYFNTHNPEGEDFNLKTLDEEGSQFDSSVEQRVLDIEDEEQRIEDQLSPPVYPQDKDDTEEGGPQIPRPLHRVKRQIDINALADAHLENSSSTGDEGSVNVMTADDRKMLEEKAKESQSSLVKYLGATLGSVALFSFIAYCFIKDPKGCITAFGTGCPCCILCLPCIRKCQERTDMERIMRENMNIYLPGVIVHDDGTIDAYKVSPEEVDIVMEIVDIITE